MTLTDDSDRPAATPYRSTLGDERKLDTAANRMCLALRQEEGKSLDAGLRQRTWSHGGLSIEFRLRINGLYIAEDENAIPRGDHGARSPKSWWDERGLVEMWHVIDRIQQRAALLGAQTVVAVEAKASSSVQTRFRVFSGMEVSH